MRMAGLAAILLGSALAWGCTTASVTHSAEDAAPSTYTLIEGVRLERTVGKLRRLGVLPVQLDVSPRDPRWCLEPCGWEGLAPAIESEAVDCLSGKRGYEVLGPGALECAVPGGFSREELEALARLLAAAAVEGSGASSDEAAQRVCNLGRQARLDGVVVVQGRATSLCLADWVAGYASFTLTFPISFLRIGVSLRADIYEAATGRPVWTAKLRQGWEPDTANHYGLTLFDLIEPALPGVFALPVASGPPADKREGKR